MHKGRGLSESFLMKLTPEMFATIREQADAEGKSMAQWVREAITAKASKGGSAAQPWVADIETRASGDVVKEIHDAMQRWHNRGGK